MEKKGVDLFNKFLRGERSALETYTQALKSVDSAEAVELRQICSDHKEGVALLEEHVRELGGKPDATSGAWGTFAQAVQGTANLFGDTSAVKALKEGEEHGLNDYSEALEENELMPKCRQIINERIMVQRQHISALDTLISGM